MPTDDLRAAFEAWTLAHRRVLLAEQRLAMRVRPADVREEVARCKAEADKLLAHAMRLLREGNSI